MITKRIWPMLLALCLVGLCQFLASAHTANEVIARSDSAASSASHTLVLSGPERKAILDALREELRRQQGLKVVFVVNHLKVQRGWAWIETSPQSADGANRFEDVSALLQKRDGRWRVAEIACAEEGNPDCVGHQDFFTRLSRRFPAAPSEIFPSGTR